jgi:hypothetical protein
MHTISRHTALLCIACLAVTACEVSDSDPVLPESPEPPDGASESAIDPANHAATQPDEPEKFVGECDAPGDYGPPGPLTVILSQQRNQPGSMGTRKLYRMLGSLSGTGHERVRVELWDTFGAFADGSARPGTYGISGPEQDLASCGVCVFIEIGAAGTVVPTRRFLAQSGTATIDSIAGTYAGSLTNLTFAELDPETGMPRQDGCEAALGSASFSAPLEVIPGGGGGGGGGRHGGRN